jgi:hypothetical protein
VSSPLEARIERTANGWSIRVPVRREEVTVRRRPDPDATQPLDTAPPIHHDTLAGTGMDQEPLS